MRNKLYINARRHWSLQTEAIRLRQTAEVIAVGMGSRANEDELYYIASAPQCKNVILVQNLTEVEERLSSSSCTGQ